MVSSTTIPPEPTLSELFEALFEKRMQLEALKKASAEITEAISVAQEYYRLWDQVQNLVGRVTTFYPLCPPWPVYPPPYRVISSNTTDSEWNPVTSPTTTTGFPL